MLSFILPMDAPVNAQHKDSSCLLSWPMPWQIFCWFGLMLNYQFHHFHLLSFHAQSPSSLWGIKQDPCVAQLRSGQSWLSSNSVRPRYRQKNNNRAGNGRNKNQLSHKHCWNIVRGKQLPRYNTAHFHLLIYRLSSFQKFALKLMSLWNYLLSYTFRRWHLDKFKKLLLSHFTDLYHFSTSQPYACIF